MKARIPIQLTKKQQKAMDKEIRRQCAELHREYESDVDAMILWAIHIHFKSGKRQLRNFWRTLRREHDRLVEYYQMEDDDKAFLCDYKLREMGVDVRAWRAEEEATGNDSGGG